jgi:hypothetical protein
VRVWTASSRVDNALTEQTLNIILSDAVAAYLEPSIRQGTYAAVKPVRLAIILAKLARGLGTVPTSQAQQRADRRRREADQVGALANAGGR